MKIKTKLIKKKLWKNYIVKSYVDYENEKK